MGRAVILGNGQLTVGLDEHGLVHDFYYPYVGLDNLTTARSVHHKIGVWVDSVFSWVDDNTWNISVDFENNGLISDITLEHSVLGIKLQLHDFVDFEYSAFCRYVTVTNHSDKPRNIRVFMHQVFQISRAGRADTALFVPSGHYVLAYKGRCCLLIAGQHSDGSNFDQFAVGNYGIEGKEGTFRDAEDGELSGSAVEHGGVDSVIRFSLSLDAGAEESFDYWVAASDSEINGEAINDELKKQGLLRRLEANRAYWLEWLAVGANVLHSVDREYLSVTKKSLLLIKAHIDKNGGVIASCDSSIYNYGRDYYSYVWPRDGAYAIWPLIRLGYKEEPKKFFEFCRDVLTPEGYLAHKYQTDRAIGSTWHPRIQGSKQELAFQEDETATVLFMLGEYYHYSKDQEFVESMYEAFVKPAADFMMNFIDEQTGLPHASYDLWEMKFCTTTYTTAAVYQALLVAAEMSEEFGQPEDGAKWKATADKLLQNSEIFYDPDSSCYRKGFLHKEDGALEFENTIDTSSFYGVMIYGYYTSLEQVHSTRACIEDRLLDKSPAGGVARFENDGYFRANSNCPGNPWIISTLWLAQYYIRTKQPEKARAYISWANGHALSSGLLPEQVDPDSGYATSVSPLVWSQAEFINTVLDLTQTPPKNNNQ